MHLGAINRYQHCRVPGTKPLHEPMITLSLDVISRYWATTKSVKYKDHRLNRVSTQEIHIFKNNHWEISYLSFSEPTSCAIELYKGYKLESIELDYSLLSSYEYNPAWYAKPRPESPRCCEHWAYSSWVMAYYDSRDAYFWLVDSVQAG